MKNYWTETEKEYIRSNISKTSKEIAVDLGRTVQATCVMICRLGLSRVELDPRSGIKSKFTNTDIDFIKDNIQNLNNKEIADQLGKTLTVVRNKIYELGLQRTERPDAWSDEQTKFLLKSFRSIGDVELGEIMNEKFPDSKRKFGRRTIHKKRKLLGLIRTEDEVKAICSQEAHKARCNTILQNSGSLNYKDGWVALTLASKNHPERIRAFLKYPELIEAKRIQLKLNRAIKHQNDDNNSNSIH